MTPEETDAYGARSVIRSLAGGPTIGLRKRAKKKFPRLPAEATAMATEQLGALAEKAEGRTLGTDGQSDLSAPRYSKNLKRKTEQRRFY